MPQISVTSITQTPDGYLWLGTFSGLVRFDGVRFTLFDEANAPALGSSGIVQVMSDSQGGLWSITREGTLVRLADGEFTRYDSDRGLPSCGAFSLVWDLEQRLLVVDGNFSLHRLEGGNLAPYHQDARVEATPHPLLSGWVETDGIAVTPTKQPVRLPVLDGKDRTYMDLVISCTARARDTGFWFASTSGVYRFKDGVLQGPMASFPQPIRALVAMSEDRQGNLWIGSWSDGLFRMDRSGQWQRFYAGAGLAESDVTSVFIDREDCVWVGTGRGGLHRLKPRIFRTYDSRDGLAGNTVMSVTEDRQGRLWIGINGGGLNWWQNGRFAPVTEPPEVRKYPLVYSVLIDRQDAVWAGLYGAAALRLQAGATTLHVLGDGSRTMTPRSLFEDQAGTLWLGCDHGLQSFQGGKFTLYTRENGLAHDEVRALAEDRSGTLYIGTHGGGLNCFRSNQFSCLTEKEGLPDNHVSALWVDRDDTLWIGTVRGGVSRFRQGRFASVTMRDGLPSNTIGTILEDNPGYLWFGSKQGIARVSRRELNDYLDNRQPSLICRVFNRSDGLNTIDCTGGGQPSSWKTRDGKLCFATVRGLGVVDPDRLPFNSLPPPVILEEVAVEEVPLLHDLAGRRWITSPDRPSTLRTGGQATAAVIPGLQSQGPTDQPINDLRILLGKRRLEFRFTALSLVAPEKVRFRYRLNDLDMDWREAGAQRSASYQHVPPGKYRFEVIACNNDGIWNESGASLALTVLPPWWMTWWFRSLLLATAVGLTFGWYERRLHRLRREHLAQESFSRRLIASQEKERQRIAGELHDGMGQDLLIIASQAQLSLARDENPVATAARLKDIADTAKRAVQQARHMAHNLRPGLLDELGFRKAVQATLDRAAQASGIAMAVHLAQVDGLLPAEFEVNLYRIIQETLNNMLKHAEATEAKITLTKEPAGLRLVVEDNGRGFDLSRLESSAPDQRGFGLHQIAERAKMMRGRVDIQARPGQGTRIIVEVPLLTS